MTVLQEIGPEFERTTGHTLNVSSDIAANMVRRVESGEAFDILVASPSQIEGLIRRGKLIEATRTTLTRSGIGVEVRAGAARPDVSTMEAFRRELLSARSIGYL